MTPTDPEPSNEDAGSLPAWMSPPEKAKDADPSPTQVPPADRPAPWAQIPAEGHPGPAQPPDPFNVSRDVAWAPAMVVHETAPIDSGPLTLAPTGATAHESAPPPPRTSHRIETAPAIETGPASAPDRLAPPSERSALGFFRDNLEAFAFAILLALLLRHLSIEVFKIPTKSMEPTLFGDDSYLHPKTAGDRIAVDKTAYLFHGPRRWDVVVFRFPLDWTRNFIKRVAGLPNESVKIERGDLWTSPTPAEGQVPDYHPARKPKSVRDQLFVPIYPPSEGYTERLPASFWRDDTPAESGFAPIAAFDEFKFLGGREKQPGADVPAAVLRYGHDIYSGSRAGTDPTTRDGFLTPDVRVRGTIETTGPAEWTLEWRPGDKRVHTLTLASKGAGESYVHTTRERRALPLLREQGVTTFEFESVDGDLHVMVDGEELAVLKDEISLADAMSIESSRAGLEPQGLSMSIRGAPLVLRNVRVDHDLYYTNHVADSTNSPESGDAWRVPDDSYFMLGDNTTQSNDSRRWNAQGVKLKGGAEIWYDPSPSMDKDEEPHYPLWKTRDGLRYEVRRDVEGVVRQWTPGDLAPDSGTLGRRMPFVSRERIVGRAWFAMYADVAVWPLNTARISTSGRIRFIH